MLIIAGIVLYILIAFIIFGYFNAHGLLIEVDRYGNSDVGCLVIFSITWIIAIPVFLMFLLIVYGGIFFTNLFKRVK